MARRSEAGSRGENSATIEEVLGYAWEIRSLTADPLAPRDYVDAKKGSDAFALCDKIEDLLWAAPFLGFDHGPSLENKLIVAEFQSLVGCCEIFKIMFKGEAARHYRDHELRIAISKVETACARFIAMAR